MKRSVKNCEKLLSLPITIAWILKLQCYDCYTTPTKILFYTPAMKIQSGDVIIIIMQKVSSSAQFAYSLQSFSVPVESKLTNEVPRGIVVNIIGHHQLVVYDSPSIPSFMHFCPDAHDFIALSLSLCFIIRPTNNRISIDPLLLPFYAHLISLTPNCCQPHHSVPQGFPSKCINSSNDPSYVYSIVPFSVHFFSNPIQHDANAAQPNKQQSVP